MVIVVEPLTPVPDAVHELATDVSGLVPGGLKLSSPNTSERDVLTSAMLVEVVTDPVGPRLPEVLTVIWPELKKVAGPTTALPDGSVAVCGLLDASAASVTVGAGPRMFGGPPKRPTLAKQPKALPSTSVTTKWLADAGWPPISSVAPTEIRTPRLAARWRLVVRVWIIKSP